MAINPMMFPAFMGMGGQPPQQPQMQQPMAPQLMQQPQAPQGPNSLAQLSQLLGGDLSGSLTGGDTLLALSGLLRSATRSGRRAGLTPDQVIGGLQKQKVAELQNRLLIEQQRAQMAQQQQQQTAMSNFVATLPPEKQALFPGLDAEGQRAMLKEHLSPQPFQIVKSGGENFMVFRDKSRVKLDIPRDVETREIDTGRSTQIRDKVTNKVILEIPKEMSQYQAGMLAVSQSNLAFRQAESRRRPSGGGGGSAPQTQLRSYFKQDNSVTQGEVRWDKGKDSWTDRAGNPVRLAPSAAPGIIYAAPPPPGERRFGN